MKNKHIVPKILIAAIAIILFALQFISLFISLPELITLQYIDVLNCKEHVLNINEKYSSSVKFSLIFSTPLLIIIILLLPFVKFNKKNENT